MLNSDIPEYLRKLADTASKMKCTIESHNARKLNDEEWSRMVKVGIQEVCPEYDLELRNCNCGSTLARRIPPKTKMTHHS